jgi:hypothetical protein
MSDEEVQAKIPAKPVRQTPMIQRIAIYAAVLLLVFLLGFVPMWLKVRRCSETLAKTEHELVLIRLQNDLASAVIDARRGNYEPARQAASKFFSSLQVETDIADGSNFTPDQRVLLRPLGLKRDEIITLLARGDPASTDRLSDLYLAYRQIIKG